MCLKLEHIQASLFTPSESVFCWLATSTSTPRCWIPSEKYTGRYCSLGEFKVNSLGTSHFLGECSWWHLTPCYQHGCNKFASSCCQTSFTDQECLGMIFGFAFFLLFHALYYRCWSVNSDELTRWPTVSGYILNKTRLNQFIDKI